MAYTRKKYEQKNDGLTDEERIQQDISHTRMPRGLQLIGRIDQLLGAKRMYVECSDGRKRLCRVPGRAKRRVWVRPGDYVIVEPWSIEGDEKGDVVWKYKKAQSDHLRRIGKLDGI